MEKVTKRTSRCSELLARTFDLNKNFTLKSKSITFNGYTIYITNEQI
jgi:hypothetical protein